MPGLSKVIVLDPDARAGRQIQLGFEREGVAVASELIGGDLAGAAETWAAPGADVGAVIVGGVDGTAIELVKRVRAWIAEHQIAAPLVLVDRGMDRAAVVRADAEAAGADEIVRAPAYLRDVVTISRLVGGRTAEQRSHVVGNLAEIAGVFPLIRALSALGRSATLGLVRGLRRGEVRFFHGEVTSAQIGMIHGQAALHQLLLWTDARFDFQHEDIVRRQQIPLTPDELFADAQRFLESVRESSGGLSPSMVLEQDVPRVQSLGKQIPTEVYGVLRMFDGYRVLADVLEDSAYRVFETLRVAQRAVEVGLLRIANRPVIKTSWKSLHAIEDWLLGHEARDAIDTGPMPRMAPPADVEVLSAGKPTKKARRKKKKRTDTPVSIQAANGAQEINWGALVPRTVGGEVGTLSGVVPSAHVSGEIEASASAPREIGAPQPKVVLEEARPVEPPPAPPPPTPPAPPPEPEPPTVTIEAEPAPGPVEIADEPSDGVIIQHITTADTAPVKRRRPPPGEIPVDDRPVDTTGEITLPRPRPVTPAPRPSEPSILIADEITSGQVTMPTRATAEAHAIAPAGAESVPLTDDAASTREPTAPQTIAAIAKAEAEAPLAEPPAPPPAPTVPTPAAPVIVVVEKPAEPAPVAAVVEKAAEPAPAPAPPPASD
ncbi:MAG TPA: DUF4388 domain-containing protein, partial [Kofleriaceae bacterium]|nr:DUF4388 domain-containing protein [Kofleriaceae bacterium]